MGVGVFAIIIGVLLIALPFLYIIKPFDFTINVPKSQILLAEHFVVPTSTVTHSIHLNAETNVR